MTTHDAVAVMTSGGDAPGMNAAVRAVVRTGLEHGRPMIGIRGGYDGVIDGDWRAMGARDVGGILPRGGTILGTRRSERFFDPAHRADAATRLRDAGVGALVVIGGEGSTRGAAELMRLGIRVAVVPASIDNDIAGTDMAIGVDTALNTIVEAVDKLRDTASAHNRCFIVETMGRGSGYLASVAGVVCGAETVLVPEVKRSAGDVVAAVENAYDRGKTNAIVIAAEGANIGVGELLRALSEAKTGFDVRVSRLGHIQRGGSPSAFDRLLAARMGTRAVDWLVEGRDGFMAGLNGRVIEPVPIAEVIGATRLPPSDLLGLIATLAR